MNKNSNQMINKREMQAKFHLCNLFLMKGWMSKERPEMSNKESVSPSRGKPMEPGGRIPLHLGFLHFSTQYPMKIVANPTTTHTPTDHISP